MSRNKKKHILPVLICAAAALAASGGAVYNIAPDIRYLLANREQDAGFSPEPIISNTEQTVSAMESSITIPSKKDQKSDFLYYYQTDDRWKDYLCAGRDPMEKYGCGPTAMAMVVTNLTDQTITPPEMAEWADENGYYSPGNGSMHSLIPAAAEAFGLRAESLSVRTPEAMQTCLENDKLLVLLMGPGHFTDGGHFILVISVNDDGTVNIADPVDPEHSQLVWEPSLLLSELSKADDSGGPGWAISRKD